MPSGSVSTRATKCIRCRAIDILRLCDFQDAEHREAAAEQVQPGTMDRNRLVAVGTEAKKVAKFVATSTESARRLSALEAAHGWCGPSMVLTIAKFVGGGAK
jgi:hypothetical protein